MSQSRVDAPLTWPEVAAASPQSLASLARPWYLLALRRCCTAGSFGRYCGQEPADWICDIVTSPGNHTKVRRSTSAIDLQEESGWRDQRLRFPRLPRQFPWRLVYTLQIFREEVTRKCSAGGSA